MWDRARVGKLIRERREAVGLSLRAAARATQSGMSHSWWQQIESGVAENPGVDMLDDIGRTLGVRWEVRLVPEGPRMGELQAKLLDNLAAIVDRLDERDVKRLVSELEFYRAELGDRGSQGQSRK